MIDKEQLKNEAHAFSSELSSDALDKFDTYAELLCKRNAQINLTAITEPSEIVTKHFTDSLAVFKFVDIPNGAKIIDVGCGAGFPSLPIKIFRPDSELFMLDSLQKRLNFINSVLEAINLSATTVHSRGEDAGRQKDFRETFDFAVARAVASLPVLSEYCLPFVKVGGAFIAFKGSADETDAAKNAVRELGGKTESVFSYTLPNGDARQLVVVRKISQTPTKYPRTSKKISSKPL